MASQQSSWPIGWPSFTPSDNDPDDEQQLNVKREIISEYGEAALKEAWVKTCKALDTTMSSIAQQGSAAVPVFQFDDVIGPQNSSILARMKQTGCFIVRNVIPRHQAAEHFDELRTFIANNPEITGWPAESPAIFHLYNSPTQLKLRTHPNQLRIQRQLNSLFEDASCSAEELEGQHEPILYPDALRIREPGQEFLGLGPHIDGGSLCRWADRKYRLTYDKIFSGCPEDFDPFEISHRKDANPAMFPSGVHSSVLRTFQGWTALTAAGPGEAGLMLLPDIKTVTAYMILRPFFTPPDDGRWQNPDKWIIDDTAWFPGTKRWDSQLLSLESHPHLRMRETLVSVPKVEPGDTNWWHADMCHAVETTHNGSSPASVVYIPSAPSTPANKAYIRRYWKDLLAGIPPDDYKFLDGTGDKLVLSTQNERCMVGTLPIESISTQGRRALGEDV